MSRVLLGVCAFCWPSNLQAFKKRHLYIQYCKRYLRKLVDIPLLDLFFFKEENRTCELQIQPNMYFMLACEINLRTKMSSDKFEHWWGVSHAIEQWSWQYVSTKTKLIKNQWMSSCVCLCVRASCVLACPLGCLRDCDCVWLWLWLFHSVCISSFMIRST